MNIKKRLILSNTLTVFIPLLFTIIVAFTFIFISSTFLKNDISIDNFKKLLSVKAKLLMQAAVY